MNPADVIEMIASLLRCGDCTPEEQRLAATKLALAAPAVRKLQLTLDGIVQNEADDARLAEERARVARIMPGLRIVQ